MRTLLPTLLLVIATVFMSGCTQKRGLPCAICGKTAVYTPGVTAEGLRYVCPDGHVTRSNRLVR